MQVLTVGCSEGHDATAWHTTITKPRIQNFLQRQPDLRGHRVRCGSQARALGRRAVHGRRLHRRHLQFCRAAGKPRPVRHAAIDLQPARPQQLDGALRAGLAGLGDAWSPTAVRLRTSAATTRSPSPARSRQTTKSPTRTAAVPTATFSRSPIPASWESPNRSPRVKPRAHRRPRRPRAARPGNRIRLTARWELPGLDSDRRPRRRT